MQLIQLSILCFIASVYCYPSGAPYCQTTVPHHNGNKPRTDKSPYTLETSTPRVLSSGQTVVNVTITGAEGKAFKGFHLTARTPDSDTTVGTFTATDQGHTLQCDTSSNAITHNNNKDKTSVSFTWTSTQGFSGQVLFSATVVMNYENFYTNIRSSQVTIK